MRDLKDRFFIFRDTPPPLLCWNMAYNVGNILALSSWVVAGSADVLADWIVRFPDFFWGFCPALGIVVMDYIFWNVYSVAVKHKSAGEGHVIPACQQSRNYVMFVGTPRLVFSSHRRVLLTRGRCWSLVPSTLFWGLPCFRRERRRLILL